LAENPVGGEGKGVIRGGFPPHFNSEIPGSGGRYSPLLFLVGNGPATQHVAGQGEPSGGNPGLGGGERCPKNSPTLGHGVTTPWPGHWGTREGAVKWGVDWAGAPLGDSRPEGWDNAFWEYWPPGKIRDASGGWALDVPTMKNANDGAGIHPQATQNKTWGIGCGQRKKRGGSPKGAGERFTAFLG